MREMLDREDASPCTRVQRCVSGDSRGDGPGSGERALKEVHLPSMLRVSNERLAVMIRV